MEPTYLQGPEDHAMTTTSENGPAAEPPVGAVDGVVVIPFTGAVDLDVAAATNVQRLVDARLHLADLVGVPLRHLIIDLSGVRRIDPRALRPLAEVRRSAARRHVGVHLVGLGVAAARLSPDARHQLSALGCYPTVDVARSALAALATLPTARSAEDCINVRGGQHDAGPRR
jgi:anti-anti-sigma regulatory factor